MPLPNNFEIDPSILNDLILHPDIKKDLIDTAAQIKKQPFDRIGAIKRIKINNEKYPEWFMFASSITDKNNIKPLEELQDTDLLLNLESQLKYIYLQSLTNCQ